MIRVCLIPLSPENKRCQIRKNILEGTYSKKIDVPFQTFENPRLQYRFAEALDDATEKCYVSGSSEECFAAWQEVDELEDSIMRLGIEVFPDYSMRYGSLLRRTFKLRWNVRNVEDHHVIPKEFKSHPVVTKVKYDIHASENIIMMPREIGNLRENRHVHRSGGHKGYNKYVKNVLNSMEILENPEPEFKKFVDFLKIGCRFRPQDIPWN